MGRTMTDVYNSCGGYLSLSLPARLDRTLDSPWRSRSMEQGMRCSRICSPKGGRVLHSYLVTRTILATTTPNSAHTQGSRYGWQEIPLVSVCFLSRTHLRKSACPTVPHDRGRSSDVRPHARLREGRAKLRRWVEGEEKGSSVFPFYFYFYFLVSFSISQT